MRELASSARERKRAIFPENGAGKGKLEKMLVEAEARAKEERERNGIEEKPLKVTLHERDERYRKIGRRRRSKGKVVASCVILKKRRGK